MKVVDTGDELTRVQRKPCSSCYSQQGASSTPPPRLRTTASPATPPPATPCFRRPPGRPASVAPTDRPATTLSAAEMAPTLAACWAARGSTSVGRASTASSSAAASGTFGLMGLGRTQLSLVFQTTSQFGGFFSYCLPTRILNSSRSCSLQELHAGFGHSNGIISRQAPFYFLNRTGASIGGVPLDAAGFSNGRTLIDSGTVITRLPPSIYQTLKAEFVRQFSGYPPAPSFSILETCFNLSAYEEVKVPKVRFGFEGGAEMNVDVTGILYLVKKDASQVCLAIASLQFDGQVGIIGNYQQKNQSGV